MLKLLGSVMLLCGCIGIGWLRVNQMDKRIKTLQTLICGLEVMERELSFRMPLLEEILCVAARSTEGQTGRFLSVCVDELNKDLSKPFYEIWNRAIHEHLTALKKSDLDPVIALGSILGRYDEEEQRKAIVQACGGLKLLHSNAVAERGGQSKMYKVLGTTAGALLVILLL